MLKTDIDQTDLDQYENISYICKKEFLKTICI